MYSRVRRSVADVTRTFHVGLIRGPLNLPMGMRTGGLRT